MDGLGLQPAPPSRSPLSARAFGSEVLLGELIGRGGMSRVFRGWLRTDGTEVAVKVLRDDLAANPDAVQRFVRERDLLAAVASPHVVRVHDLVVHGDELGIVMDLVPGGHLRRAVAAPCPPAEAAALAVQIADGLAAVHATGVVHRDLKPENVLVDRDATGAPLLRLTDFGISRLVDSGLTQTSVTGTPGYLAPEIAGGGKVTAAADVYALGVVLYELCTGRGPFLADNPLLMVLAHTRQQAPRPGGMPDALWQVLAAMLAKDPAARPSAAGVAATLRALLPGLDGLPVCDPPPAPATDALPTAEEAPPTVAGSLSTGSDVQRSDVQRADLQAPATVASRIGAPPTGSQPRHHAGAPVELGTAGRRDGGARDGLLARTPVLVAAGVGAILMVVLAVLGVRAALHPDTATLIDPSPTEQSTAPPTGPVDSAPADESPADAGPDPVVTVTAVTQVPGASSPTKGGAPVAPTPTPSPGVPTLSRPDPSDAERHSTDGKVTLVVGAVSPGAGTVASISVAVDDRKVMVPLAGSSPDKGYPVTVGELQLGREYSFTATVCSTTKLCTPSAPFTFTPYGAPQVEAPSISASGRTVTVNIPPVSRNGNTADTRCFLDVSSTPSDTGAPQHQQVSPDGDTAPFTGKSATTYKATVTCETAGIDDGSAASGTVTTAAAPTPSPSVSVTPTPTPSSSVTPVAGAKAL